MEALLSQLNNKQREAVERTEGPVMVVAGAGSGKTRVLTYRIAYLLASKVPAWRILALTFTNKAAREMKERIAKLVGWEHANSLWMGTFHSIFARILRMEGTHLGFPNNFTIYDTDDSRSLIKAIIKAENLDPKVYQPSAVLGRISWAKTNLISPLAYNDNTEWMNRDKSNGLPMLGELYTKYQNKLREAAAMDFDDLLYYTNILFQKFPEVLKRYQDKFQYILVDEYQDTNYCQYLIVNKLAANNSNVCVVGDDAQSIYAFRGANIENIQYFQRDYPKLHIVKLEQNYRSTQNIVNAANAVIHNNTSQIHKNVWTDNPKGDKIQLIRARSDRDEASMVAHQIFQIQMNKQLKLDAFAILYRTNAQSRVLEEALRKLNMPYRIYGGVSFYKRKEIKDLLAYFRLVVNPLDDEAIKRIINYPARGIGKSTLERLHKTGMPLWQALHQLSEVYPPLKGATLKRLVAFRDMIEGFIGRLHQDNAHELAMQIAEESGIMTMLQKDKSTEGVARYELIDELMNGIAEFVEGQEDSAAEREDSSKYLDMYMQDIALLTDADETDKTEQAKISMMTIHQAKGLEFPYVFVTGLEENLFPSMQVLNSKADLEEERRLFYVALTRAERRATLSYAETRYKYGRLDFCESSRFLDEIDEQYTSFANTAKKSTLPQGKPRSRESVLLGHLRINAKTTKSVGSKPAPSSNYKILDSNSKPTDNKPQRKAFVASNIDDIQAGCLVQHQLFGQGEVLSVEGAGPNKKAQVQFESETRTLILKFAHLRIISNTNE